jgi:hypothetical protein
MVGGIEPSSLVSEKFSTEDLALLDDANTQYSYRESDFTIENAHSSNIFEVPCRAEYHEEASSAIIFLKERERGFVRRNIKNCML